MHGVRHGGGPGAEDGYRQAAAGLSPRAAPGLRPAHRQHRHGTLRRERRALRAHGTGSCSGNGARSQVQPDGSVRWVGGAANSGSSEARWLSLDSIAFVPNGHVQHNVPLSQPWVPYGTLGYQDPQYLRVNGASRPFHRAHAAHGRNARADLCVISGLTRTELWRAESMSNPVFVLGPDCQPDRRLVFLVNSQHQSFRLDVRGAPRGCARAHFTDAFVQILPNGEGRLIGTQGQKHDAFISLSGLIFFVAGACAFAGAHLGHSAQSVDARLRCAGQADNETATTLDLKNNWVPAADVYRTPSWRRNGDLCVLSGVARAAKGAWHPHIATVPERSKCRPELKLTFFVYAWKKGSLQGTGKKTVQRIDVRATRCLFSVRACSPHTRTRAAGHMHVHAHARSGSV